MGKILRFSEKLFAVLSLFFFSNGLFAFFLGGSSELSPDTDSPLLRSIFLLIYFISISILVLRWRKTLLALRKHQWILFLLVLAFLSTFWSSVPDITFRKTIALAGSTVFGIYFGTHYNFDEQLKIMGWMFGISAILSLLFVVLLPHYGIMNTSAIVGAWQGIYLHKSTFGERMFICFLIFYFLGERARKRRIYRFIFRLMCILSAVLIYFSDSATSLVNLIFFFTALRVLKSLSLRSKSSVLLVLIFLFFLWVSVLLLAINFVTFLQVSNKDITLTGRIPLWDSLLEFTRLKLAFGYGYGSFFSAPHYETQLVWKIHTWKPPNSHNGYIELFLALGFVGYFTFVLGYFYNLVKALFSYLTLKDIKMLWVFSFLLYTIFFNFLEVSFMAINNINWVISLSCLYLISSAPKSYYNDKN